MNADDNTLVLFFSDNGASAEIMIRGDGHDPAAPQGSAATFLSLGPGWSNAANTPFRRHKIWVARRRHRHAADRPLARRNFSRPANCGTRSATSSTSRPRSSNSPAARGQKNPTEKNCRRTPGHDLSPTFARRCHHRARLPLVAPRKQSGDPPRRLEARRRPRRTMATLRPRQRPRRKHRPRSQESGKSQRAIRPLAKEARRIPTTRPRDAPEQPKPKNRAQRRSAQRHPESLDRRIPRAA